MIAALLLALSLTINPESTRIDPSKSVFVTVTLTTAAGETAELPDLRNRVVGFSLAEDFEEEPVRSADGSTTFVARWRLVPAPVSEAYRIRPTAVGSVLVPAIDFDPPEPLPPVTGEMESDPQKDLPPLSWKLVGFAALVSVGALTLLYALFLLLRYLSRRVREHRMSPIERAWAELDRLLRKGLPGRGRYKDFYVELTLVVRRYIQRKYGVKAPHLTTEEFLADVSSLGNIPNLESLSSFLSSADLIKFAGVEATPETADEATEAARDYLRGDNA